MVSSQHNALVWFRRDLRLHDNEIITKAAANHRNIVPFFIIDPWFYEQPEISVTRVKFLFESLENLDLNLRQRGSRLYLFEGHSLGIIQSLTLSLLQQKQSPKLYFHRDVQVKYGIERDRCIHHFYRQHNLEIYLGQNHFLQANGEDYPNWWRDYHQYQQQPLYQTPQQIKTAELNFEPPQLTINELKQKYNSFITQESYCFLGGEYNAQKTLASFISHRYQGYHWKMSRPWLAQQGATSHLSAHLDFGTISSRFIYQEIVKLLSQLPPKSKAQFSLKSFLDRLRWHDKFTQRHYFHPEFTTHNRYPEFDSWYSPEALTDEKLSLFTAWQLGKTGFPLVDASMRQLNQMGWINFRMRAMCVTFLSINCGVSWHHGARYFMSRLVDGNIAINHWQWQAQSGITNPLSKTFRIYNPTKNLQDKDPSLQFVHYWVPELRGYNLQQLLNRDYSPINNYPPPILDWQQTRKTNGKIVSDSRKKVRERLEQEQGTEYQQAIALRDTVEKYLAVKDMQYNKIEPI
ncbi:MAG: FAD-binding domain-containing protein [Cyanobacteria bacterium P01_G01_bin.39]